MRHSLVAGGGASLLRRRSTVVPPRVSQVYDGLADLVARHADDVADRERLAERAVDTAVHAGAQYVDARLTYTLLHPVRFTYINQWFELTGVGVRALCDGYWGFASSPDTDAATIDQLARDAVAQAKSNARGTPRAVELGTIPVAKDRWVMPVKVDPFTVAMDEKLAYVQYWIDCAHRAGFRIDELTSGLYCLRQERVLATSDGACYTQTVYESAGKIMVADSSGGTGLPAMLPIQELTAAAKGWELFLDADIPGQLRQMDERFAMHKAAVANPKPIQIGRYTLVCDGATMATLLDRTLGVATQLDRAMGYEANASGTSFLNDPLGMLDTFQVASPLVTVTANRSTPGHLATVRWDDEGVSPENFTLVQEGILSDYQTTREQAAWLAPYYQRRGKPVRSHGCAIAESGLAVTMQSMPNLALTAPSTATLDDLVANVRDGILVTDGDTRADFQMRTGVLLGTFRKITNGVLGRPLVGGAVMYDTLDLWKNVTAIAGPMSRRTIASTPYDPVIPNPYQAMFDRWTGGYPVKGEPPQRTSYSVQSVAAMITNQTMVDLSRKA